MITIEQARQAMKAGTTVRGTDKHGNTHEGIINGVWVIAPTGYKQMGRVLPCNAPAGEWQTVVDISFPISDTLQSGATYTLEELEIVEPEVEEIAAPKITSIQLSTNHTHVWEPVAGAQRVVKVLTHYKTAVWYVEGEGAASGTTYIGILGAHGQVDTVYVIES